MPFKIIIILYNQKDYIKKMIKSLDEQFDGIMRLFVVDRSDDGSIELLKKLNENFIENKEGNGFLAGKIRDIGIDYLNDDSNLLFLDGDRIPVNFSIDLVNKSLELFDMCLCSVENDIREFDNTFKSLAAYRYVFHNGVFTCGFSIRKSTIKKIKSLEMQQGRLFNSQFDGFYGEEDRFLGDCVNHVGGIIGKFPKYCYLEGSFKKIKDYSSYRNQLKKRIILRRKLFSKN